LLRRCAPRNDRQSSMKYLLGYDIGSSSVKATLLEAETGKTVASATSPSSEMQMSAPQAGFAEQDPEMWWQELKNATRLVIANAVKQTPSFNPKEVGAIGISYQMHGLVVVDKNQKALRPSIIWCDSRAVAIGEKAFNALGKKYCLAHYLNAPGNFTASKMRWVLENESKLAEKIDKIMLPGDYIAMRMSGDARTTVSGLSEGIMWDFKTGKIASKLLKNYGITEGVISQQVPTFGIQGEMTKSAAEELGLAAGTPITYRAGDQPNNAFSLNVLNVGEVAATAGTSGVVYGVTDKADFDPKSRVNTFVHVNSTVEKPRNGVLLCINGTGILNSWLRRVTGGMDYGKMNDEAAKIPVGTEGCIFLPFGNGAERVLENKQLGAQLLGVDFNRHSQAHLFRAAQEGIVFALNYGVEVMKTVGVEAKTVRAGHANMFLSPVFREAFANTTGAVVELYNTDGSQGAARGAGVGVGVYKNFKEAFVGLNKIETIEPKKGLQAAYTEGYGKWVTAVKKAMSS
jgi:xylulokinase